VRQLLKHQLLECDVEEAALWYSLRNPEVAGRLVDEFVRVILLVGESPFLFAIRSDDVRSAKLNGFPHILYYTVEEDAVHILALIHGARDARSLLTERKISFEND
jgi:plasmid stabilization system protein ParE